MGSRIQDGADRIRRGVSRVRAIYTGASANADRATLDSEAIEAMQQALTEPRPDLEAAA